MTRIYYREEKLQGTPVEMHAINSKNFDFLMKCPKPQLSFELAPDEAGGYGEWFRHMLISNRARHYDAGQQGKFYLPEAIIFCDVKDHIFPSQYHFIAKIGDRLEIRSSSGGEGVEWFQTPDMHRHVTESSIIVKMHNSILSVIDFLKDYKEPERPKAPKIKGTELDPQAAEAFLARLGLGKTYAQNVVDMAGSPSDHFDANCEHLRKYGIIEPSANMHLLYLAAVSEENGTMATVDWKGSYADVLYALNRLSGTEFKNIDGSRYGRSTAGKILSVLDRQVEERTDKTIFCMDTGTDSYSFGLTGKDEFEELKASADSAGIRIYRPEK